MITTYANHYLLPISTFTTFGQILMKILKAKISVKFLILLLLLQISYIFIASTKALNVLQISTENQKSGNAWVKYLPIRYRLLHY